MSEQVEKTIYGTKKVVEKPIEIDEEVLRARRRETERKLKMGSLIMLPCAGGFAVLAIIGLIAMARMSPACIITAWAQIMMAIFILIKKPVMKIYSFINPALALIGFVITLGLAEKVLAGGVVAGIIIILCDIAFAVCLKIFYLMSYFADQKLRKDN